MARSRSTRARARYWLCTTPFVDTGISEVDPFLPLRYDESYSIGQLERGDGGYLHWQWVLYTRDKTSLGTLKTKYPTTHFEPSRSSAADAYASKEKTRVQLGDDCEFVGILNWTKGIKSFNPNSTTDWDGIKQLAKSGKLDEIPSGLYIRFYTTLKRIYADHLVAPAIQRECTVFWGPTGTGKSHRAFEQAGECFYVKMPTTKWWDGYQCQESVIIDEFRGVIDISHLLRWLDKYPVLVEVKGGTIPLFAKRFYITSNLEPKFWYPDVDNATMEALLRRLNVVYVDRRSDI